MMFYDRIQPENKAVDVWQEVPSPGLLTHDTLEDAELDEETQEPMLPVRADTDGEKSCPFSGDLRAFSWFTKYQSIYSEFAAWGFTERPG